MYLISYENLVIFFLITATKVLGRWNQKPILKERVLVPKIEKIRYRPISNNLFISPNINRYICKNVRTVNSSIQCTVKILVKLLLENIIYNIKNMY